MCVSVCAHARTCVCVCVCMCVLIVLMVCFFFNSVLLSIVIFNVGHAFVYVYVCVWGVGGCLIPCLLC